MQVLLLCNNRVGWQVTDWLRRRDEELMRVVVHHPGRRKFGPEILEASDLNESRVFDGSRLDGASGLAEIRKLGNDTAVSALFGYILREAFLRLFPTGCVNIHSSHLPYKRGTHLNVWSIVEGTPFEFFQKAWPSIRNGACQQVPQLPNAGTCHTVEDLTQTDEINLDRESMGRELIDILRARTFPPNAGAYFSRTDAMSTCG